MSQFKVQAPYVPGLKEPADLVDEPSKSRSSEGGGQEQQQQQRRQQERDYYTPGATEVVEKGGSKPSQDLDGPREGAEMSDLYSPNAAVDITTSKKQPNIDTKAAGTEKNLGKEKLMMLPLPTEPLEAVHRTLKGTFDSTRDAVQRTKQSLLDRIFPPSSATHAHKVVEEMEKDVLGNAEGSGHDMSQTRDGPRASATGAPQFIRARL